VSKKWLGNMFGDFLHTHLVTLPETAVGPEKNGTFVTVL
jgi:hypothetical protein